LLPPLLQSVLLPLLLFRLLLLLHSCCCQPLLLLVMLLLLLMMLLLLKPMLLPLASLQVTGAVFELNSAPSPTQPVLQLYCTSTAGPLYCSYTETQSPSSILRLSCTSFIVLQLYCTSVK
jgi:hypothetical protein